MWFLYVVLCNDKTLYTGISTDVNRRIIQHSAGRGAKYTASRAPVVLLASWFVGNKSQALRAEYAFKQLSKAKKLDIVDRFEGHSDIFTVLLERIHES